MPGLADLIERKTVTGRMFGMFEDRPRCASILVCPGDSRFGAQVSHVTSHDVT